MVENRGEKPVKKKGEPGTFTALLKYWRGRRGLSQLDFSLTADVSTRHVSFLETGRSRPSQEMVLRLASALDVPLHEQNVMLQAAGFAPLFDDSGEFPSQITTAIDRMLEHQEPYPLTVFDSGYRLIRANAATYRVLRRFIADPTALPVVPNVMELLFDEKLARRFVCNWDVTARHMLARVHRNVLANPNDETIVALRDKLLSYPGIPDDWQVPDLTKRSLPCLEVRLKRGDLELGFLTTVTFFSEPQNVQLQDLMIESFYPLDARTTLHCEEFAKEDSAR